MSLLDKFKGDRRSLPTAPLIKSVVLAWFGGFIGIAVVTALSDLLSVTLILGSFGASCVLVFGYPDVSFSQPRNVIVGYLITSLAGLTSLYTFGPQWWAVSAAVGKAIALMMLTRTVHPPAGANPVINFLRKR